MSHDDNPDPYEDRKLIPCPRCGAKYPELKRPTALSYTDREHDVLCLNCWLRTPKTKTYPEAMVLWNDGVYKYKDYELETGLKHYRMKKGWTQTELAAKAGVTKSTGYCTENHKTVPLPETLEKIAAALEIDVELIV